VCFHSSPSGLTRERECPLAIRFERETAFLRELLRETPDPRRLGVLSRESGWFDWDYFEEILFCSRVAPVVAVLLGAGDETATLLPERLRERIAEEGEKTAARILLKEREFHTVIPTLREAGVPSIVLKGLPFLERYYREGTLRETRDLDLLVPPERLRRAERVLREIGYSLFEGVHSSGYYKKHHFHVVYIRRGLGIDVVELHWNLLLHPGNLAVGVEDLFRDSERYDYNGMEIRVLSPRDEFAYLCACLRMEHFSSLKRLVDLERLAGKLGGRVPVEALRERGSDWGIEIEVNASLYFLHRVWGREEKGVSFPAGTARFASRFRAADLVGVGPAREVRLRVWCAAHFGPRSPLALTGRLLFPNEDFRAKMFYSEGGPVEFRTRIRRFFAGLVSAADLWFHLAISRFRGGS